MHKTMQIASLLVGAALLVGVAMPTWAVDGVILIDQNRAMAGVVTPGDAPGFPVTISLPGSYRLASNLRVPNADTTAIEITADNVYLDLNGFAILGPTVCTGSPLVCTPLGAGRGVTAGGHSGIVVINGTVQGMGSRGVSSIFSGRVEKMVVLSNGSFGILAIASAIMNNTVNSNGAEGILAFNPGSPSTVTGNTANFNSGNGIVASGTITGNTANSNDQRGFDVGGTVSGNTAIGNGSDGIVGGFSNFVGNTATDNVGYGLFLASGGYAHNVLLNNRGSNNPADQVTGGTSLGQNLCGSAAC